MRLALLSPLPPSPTGVADYSVQVLALLADDHDIDVYHDQETVDRTRLPERATPHHVSTFPQRHRERPYDVAVYQMGNGQAHGFLYDHLSRVPGLLVLHDLVLHHSRAAHFLESAPVRAWLLSPADTAARDRARPWLERWRQELAYAYPGAGDRLFEAQVGTVGDLLPFAYPLFRIPVEASRLVVVHNSFMAEAVRGEVAGAAVRVVPQPATAEDVNPGSVADLRRRLGVADADVLVGSFGLVTPEKQVATVARAVARAAAWDARIRLLLVGPIADRPRLERLLERTGVAGRAVVTGRVPLTELGLHAAAADIVAHLRYPTGRETSAALLRVLAQGRACVVSDLEHQREIAGEAVVRADPSDEEGALTRAILRLAADPDARRELGRRAAAHVRDHHSPALVRSAWDRALQEARGRRAPLPGEWPPHWPRPETPP